MADLDEFAVALRTAKQRLTPRREIREGFWRAQ